MDRRIGQVLIAMSMLTSGCGEVAAIDEEQGEAVGEAEDRIALFHYSTSATNYATVNTANYRFTVNDPTIDALMIGTVGIVGAEPGDTHLRLFNWSSGSPVEVASAGDGPGGSVSAQIRYPLQPTGRDLEVRAGCESNMSCSGTVALALRVGLLNYSTSNTSYASVNTANGWYFFYAGETISFGTCASVLFGAQRSGPTYIRLFDPNGVQVATDSAEVQACSELPKKMHVAQVTGYYQIRAGCVADLYCGGRVAVYAE